MKEIFPKFQSFLKIGTVEIYFVYLVFDTVELEVSVVGKRAVINFVSC